MKKLLLIGLIVLASCHTTKFTMGMSVGEFTSLNHNAELVRSSIGGNYVYRCNTHNNTTNKTMFYYFMNDKLVQVDEGVQRPDITIDQTIHNQ